MLGLVILYALIGALVGVVWLPLLDALGEAGRTPKFSGDELVMLMCVAGLLWPISGLTWLGIVGFALVRSIGRGWRKLRDRARERHGRVDLAEAKARKRSA